MTTTALPRWQVKYVEALPGDELFARVGHTPLFPMHRIGAAFPHVEIYAKAEWFNPSGSVKDRAAREIILAAEHNGDLIPDKILLDATSGNMGIAYATLGAARGYKVSLTMPANASREVLLRHGLRDHHGAGIGQPGRAGIRHHGNAAAAAQPVHNLQRPSRFVVLVQRDRPLGYAMTRQQRCGVTRVLGCDHVDIGKHLQCAQCDVLQVSNGRRDHI